MIEVCTDGNTWERVTYAETWSDLKEAGWDFVEVTNDNNILMTRNGYFNKFRKFDNSIKVQDNSIIIFCPYCGGKSLMRDHEKDTNNASYYSCSFTKCKAYRKDLLITGVQK